MDIDAGSSRPEIRDRRPLSGPWEFVILLTEESNFSEGRQEIVGAPGIQPAQISPVRGGNPTRAGGPGNSGSKGGGWSIRTRLLVTGFKLARDKSLLFPQGVPGFGPAAAVGLGKYHLQELHHLVYLIGQACELPFHLAVETHQLDLLVVKRVDLPVNLA